MVYAVVIYPDVEIKVIQLLRKKYDPQFMLIKPHITIVFPFPDIEQEKVEEHISKVIKKFNAFDIRLFGLVKSFDNWLFLIIDKGNNSVIELHDRLYKGILSKYLRKDIKYTPHVGLGLFKIEEEYNKAETEARKLNLDYKCKVKSIHLIHLNEDLSKIDWSREFILS